MGFLGPLPLESKAKLLGRLPQKRLQPWGSAEFRLGMGPMAFYQVFHRCVPLAFVLGRGAGNARNLVLFPGLSE